MPYAVRKHGDKWQTVNKETGKVLGTHDTKQKAEAQARLVMGKEHGWRPTRVP